jgi:hypothetical protein
MLLTLGQADLDAVGYHPAGVKFSHSERRGEQTITLTWSHKPYAQYLPLIRSLPYQGEPAQHF